jgi:hypothetical protein
MWNIVHLCLPLRFLEKMLPDLEGVGRVFLSMTEIPWIDINDSIALPVDDYV